MILSSQDKVAIKRILQDPNWAIIQRCADQFVQNAQDSFVVKDNEWETIKGALERESRIKAVRDFIGELYTNAQ